MKYLFAITIGFFLPATCNAEVHHGYFLTGFEAATINNVSVKRPALGVDLSDYQVIAEYSRKKIIYVVEQNKEKWWVLTKRLEYLGATIREVAKNKDYLPIAQRLLYSSWYTGQLDEDKNKIIKRGSMAEWLAAGKPKLLDSWWPKVQYAGVETVIPDEDGINGLAK